MKKMAHRSTPMPLTVRLKTWVRLALAPLLKRFPNLRSVVTYPPGHFYSPLIDIRQLGTDDAGMPDDGEACWEYIDLQADHQRRYYERLLAHHPALPFPQYRAPEFRYYVQGGHFPYSDAYTLSAIVREERPSQIIEIGSGFSSAVILDSLDAAGFDSRLTCIEPYPDRLRSLLRDSDWDRVSLIAKPVQGVSPDYFDRLGDGDILFIDSSHVAKVGSDVSFLLLRILPRLAPGVIVHVHDICYPHSYPAQWLRDGWCWNESLFLRAFLIGNPGFRLLAFNSYAAQRFPEIFTSKLPRFLRNPGGSLWMRKREAEASSGIP